MIFEAKKNGPYWDIDVVKQIHLKCKCSINAQSQEDLPEDIDIKADLMHEENVKEAIEYMKEEHIKHIKVR